MLATIRTVPQFAPIQFIAIITWMIVGGLLVYAYTRLRDTTLAWPIVWCFEFWAVCLVNAASLIFWGSSFRGYIIAVTSIAPTLSMLGAKRPQNGAWQFIVVTLVGVLLFPLLKGYAFGDNQTHVPVLFRWLIAAHIVIGMVNYLPTRYAVPAALFAVAQYFICRPYLPFVDVISGDFDYACLSLFIAAIWAAWSAQFGPTAVPKSGLNRLWRDFRDAYGLVWGLRVAERLNAAAAKHGWPVEFAWGGIVVKTESGELPADVEHRVERELRSMLRRFVSHDWIARRLSSEPRT